MTLFPVNRYLEVRQLDPMLVPYRELAKHPDAPTFLLTEEDMIFFSNSNLAQKGKINSRPYISNFTEYLSSGNFHKEQKIASS